MIYYDGQSEGFADTEDASWFEDMTPEDPSTGDLKFKTRYAFYRWYYNGWFPVEKELPACETPYYEGVTVSKWYPVKVKNVKGWMVGHLVKYQDGHTSWLVTNCPTSPEVEQWYDLPEPVDRF